MKNGIKIGGKSKFYSYLSEADILKNKKPKKPTKNFIIRQTLYNN